MSRCLVTGGAGFIGSHLVEALVERGENVSVLDDFNTGRRENLTAVASHTDVQHGSILDAKAIQHAVEGCEYVYHLAAIPSVQRSIDAPFATHEVCATGTLRVLEAARRAGVRRVIYAASSSAYGDTPGAVRTERDPVSPLSPYAVAKLAGEHYCRSFTLVFGLETVRVRLFNIFGPRQNARSPYSGVIPLFLTALSEARQPIIHGDGLQSRDFTFVANAVQAFMLAATAPAASGNIYNIGAGGQTSLLELLAAMQQILGTDIKPTHGPARSGDVRHSSADITLAHRDLGYEPRVSLLEGLNWTWKSLQH